MQLANLSRSFLLATAMVLVSLPSYGQFEVIPGDNPELDECLEAAAAGANILYGLADRLRISEELAVENTFLADVRNILSDEWATNLGPSPEGEDSGEWIDGQRTAALEAARSRRSVGLVSVSNQFLADVGRIQDSFQRSAGYCDEVYGETPQLAENEETEPEGDNDGGGRGGGGGRGNGNGGGSGGPSTVLVDNSHSRPTGTVTATPVSTGGGGGGSNCETISREDGTREHVCHSTSGSD